MDPITTAIVAAATAGLTETGKKAFSDAYQGLKGLVQKKFGGGNQISEAIDKLDAAPESKGWQTVLAKAMEKENAHQDAELINMAQQLFQKLKETEQGRLAMAKYQIDAKDAQIGVLGDNAKVEGGIHFGDSKK